MPIKVKDRYWHVRVNEDTFETVERYVDLNEIDRSLLIRLAVDEYIRRHPTYGENSKEAKITI